MLTTIKVVVYLHPIAFRGEYDYKRRTVVRPEIYG